MGGILVILIIVAAIWMISKDLLSNHTTATEVDEDFGNMDIESEVAREELREWGRYVKSRSGDRIRLFDGRKVPVDITKRNVRRTKGVMAAIIVIAVGGAFVGVTSSDPQIGVVIMGVGFVATAAVVLGWVVGQKRRERRRAREDELFDEIVANLDMTTEL